MKFDIMLPNCMENLLVPSRFVSPKKIGDFAKRAEKLGYHAFWGFDFIVPTAGMDLPDPEPPNWYELLTTLAYASAVTKRIKLGAGVVILPNREPVLLAKQVATVDQFSGGRFLFGLGLGGREEFLAINPKLRSAHRGNIMDEKVEALRLLLSHKNKPVSYKGEFVEFENVNMHPKPVQNPLPMYVAAHNEESLKRAAKWCMPPMVRDKEVVDVKRIMKPLMEKQGRSLRDIEIIAWADLSLESTHQAAVKRYVESRMGHFRRAQPMEGLEKDQWIGTPNEIAQKLVRLKREGIDHFIVMHTATDTFGEMEEQAQRFAEEVVPQVKGA